MNEVFEKPSVTADVAFITADNHILLIQRKNDPFKDYWALPGGFVNPNETVLNAAVRELREETSYGFYLKSKDLFGIYSKPGRDPRGWTITACYVTRRSKNSTFYKGMFSPKDDAKDLAFFDMKKIHEIQLAFDHSEIIADIINSSV